MRMQQHFFKYVNKKRKIAPLLKKKNKVYLLIKNLKTKKSSKKLNHVKIDLFFMKKIKRFKTYELNLFKKIRVFSIFNILLLESVDFNTFIQKTFFSNLMTRNYTQWKRFWQEKINNIWLNEKNIHIQITYENYSKI